MIANFQHFHLQFMNSKFFKFPVSNTDDWITFFPIRAIWYRSDLNKQSWMLDETEGPIGVRMRTKRCHINLPKVFFTSTQQDRSSNTTNVHQYYISINHTDEGNIYMQHDFNGNV